MSSIQRLALITGTRASRFALGGSRRGLNFNLVRHYAKRPTEIPPPPTQHKKKVEESHNQKHQHDKRAQDKKQEDKKPEIKKHEDKKPEDKKHENKKQEDKKPENKKHEEKKLDNQKTKEKDQVDTKKGELEIKSEKSPAKTKQAKLELNETLAKYILEEHDNIKSVVDAEPIVPYDSHLYNFLKDNNFKLEHVVENEIYKLTKEADGRLITIQFDDKLQIMDDIYDEPPEEEEARADEDQNEEEEEDEDRDDDEEEDDDDIEEREKNELNSEEASNEGDEHDFRVDIRNVSDPEGGVRIHGSAVHNGGLVFTSMERHPLGKYTPLDISYWKEEVQQAFSEWMSEHACVNDKFAYFMHELLGKRQFEDWVKVLDEFRKIVKN